MAEASSLHPDSWSLWRQAADRALSDMCVSASTGWALVQVGRLGDDVRQTDLASQLDVTQASLVRSIDQMTAAGLVERRRDPADARVSRIRLTAHGRALVTTIEAKFATLRAASSLTGVTTFDFVSAQGVDPGEGVLVKLVLEQSDRGLRRTETYRLDGRDSVDVFDFVRLP